MNTLIACGACGGVIEQIAITAPFWGPAFVALLLRFDPRRR